MSRCCAFINIGRHQEKARRSLQKSTGYAFYYWTRKFEQVASAPSPGFHAITIEEPSYKRPGELMAAVQYPSGVRLELYSSFQEVSSSYAQLLKTLTE